MFEIVLLLFVVLFSAVGMSSIMCKCWLMIFKPKNRPQVFSVIKLDNKNAEQEFLYFYEKFRWYGKDYADKIVFLNSKSLPQSCKNIINSHSAFLIREKEDALSEIL